MGFKVIQDAQQAVWGLVKNTDTLYNGQLVRCNNEGFEPLAVASGLGDQANKVDSIGLIADGASANNLVYGVVIGNNLSAAKETFDTTYKANKITYADPSSASTGDYVLPSTGLDPVGDLTAMVKVIPITSETVLEAPLYTDNFGTAPTETTLSGSPTTTGATSSAVDEAGVNSLSSIFFRDGIVRGTYRVTKDTSTTTLTWDIPTRSAPASGDKIVRVNLRSLGMSHMQIDSEAMYIDTGATITSNYFMIDVLKLDLTLAGSEKVQFRFNPYMFQTFDDID